MNSLYFGQYGKRTAQYSNVPGTICRIRTVSITTKQIDIRSGQNNLSMDVLAHIHEEVVDLDPFAAMLAMRVGGPYMALHLSSKASTSRLTTSSKKMSHT